MEYGINIDFFEKVLDLRTAAEYVSAAGFTAVDYTPPVVMENWRETMREALKIFDAYGLRVNQTHAPFNRYGKYGTPKEHLQLVARCAEATAEMGAKFMVVHGDEFDFDHLTFSPEAALEYNRDYFMPAVETAKKSGFKVAFENLFEDLDRRRFSSQADELLGLIRSYASDSVVCCWDFGHANVSFKKEAPAIAERFGSLIQCTHLHDNTGIDSHQMVMTGRIAWQDIIPVFKRFGYDGVLSVEYAKGCLPAEYLKAYIDLTYRTAEYVWNTYGA